jgi:Cysteinyl-tRNA synthetase
MDDDFNTADAISAVFELVKYANTAMAEGMSREQAEAVLAELVQLCNILGINTEPKTELLDEEVEALIEERRQARKAKDFARADAIRAQLLEMGIILEDTREGVKWKRA